MSPGVHTGRLRPESQPGVTQLPGGTPESKPRLGSRPQSFLVGAVDPSACTFSLGTSVQMQPC